MSGKEVHCTFFRANLRANVCTELGYKFCNDISAEYVDVVSFLTPKRLGVAGVKAEVGGLCALSALYYTLTGRKSGKSSVLSQFFITFGRYFTFIRFIADKKVPKHNVRALRLAIVAKMRSPGFSELLKNQLGYNVSEYEIAESEDNGSLAEFWVSCTFNTV